MWRHLVEPEQLVRGEAQGGTQFVRLVATTQKTIGKSVVEPEMAQDAKRQFAGESSLA